jgi:hypothetical protein
LLTGPGIQKAIVTVDNGKLVVDSLKKDEARYYITVGEQPKTTVTVRFKKINHVYVYRNKPIPDPEIRLSTDSGRFAGGQITSDKFRSARFLVPILNSFDYNTSFKVLNYKLTAIVNNQKTTNYYEGSMITSGLVKNAVSGDIFIFHDVIIEFIPDKEIRTLSGLSFVVK